MIKNNQINQMINKNIYKMQQKLFDILFLTLQFYACILSKNKHSLTLTTRLYMFLFRCWTEKWMLNYKQTAANN